jgi:hypothetical protein
MEVNWYKLLYFSLMCVGFASSLNVTTGKTVIYNTIYRLGIATVLSFWDPPCSKRENK